MPGYYFVQATTVMILVLAMNTGFTKISNACR